MKKRIQKYLSGSNEGFSLVELIIVIAIMAILVGVVALAVIPYLEKSRESKDLQALDTLASAATTAVADAKVTQAGSLTIDTSSTTWGTQTAGSDAEKIQNAIKSTLGEAVPTFSSNAAKNQTITVKWDTSKNIVAVYIANTNADWQASVTIGNDTTPIANVAACQYNDHALFCISNTKVNGTATEKS
ncbi:MAG: prepilin-type N-terminal cleavage/methylation domain-containing protein [Clostridiales bacterium]|nr:prepilin-type N-terminal cleavage/methylation domain-containing protein [Clostridiales bacterium]